MLTNRSLNSTLDRMLTLNRALDQALSTNWSSNGREWVPAIDVIERKDAYVMYAELPGVDASQVEIGFEQNVLTIRGSRNSPLDPSKDGELRVFAAERVFGTFGRSIRLPEFVDAEHIRAHFADGLLTITVPKAQAAQPRKIEIHTSQNTDAQISSN